jgi:hypothetical protein
VIIEACTFDAINKLDGTNICSVRRLHINDPLSGAVMSVERVKV